MASVKDSYLHKEVLKELNYPFANVFVFIGFFIVEVKEGVKFTWDNHGKIFAQDIAYFLGTDGKDLIYISNRINSYSVVAQDWHKFFKSSYNLKGYYVVSSNYKGTFNLLIEGLFFKDKIKNFTSLEEAVKLAKSTLSKSIRE